MKRSHHKKLSGAEGRKRKKEQDESNKKSIKVMSDFLQKGKNPGSLANVDDNNLPSTSKSTTIDLNVQAEISSHDGSEGEGKGQEDLGERECVDTGNIETLVSSQVDVPLDVTKQEDLVVATKKTIPDVIEHQDVGHLNFDISGNVTVSDALRTEIIMRGSSFFQNISGPFAVKNKRSLSIAWFKKTPW